MTADHGVTLGEAARVWWRIALLSFGGPAGQIALMHRVLAEEKQWISEERFLHALNFCMLLPGPEAQQLATYIGWLLHKTKGGLVAGILFVIPGMVAIMILSWLYAIYGMLGAVGALFFGLKAAVLAIVFEAVQRIGRRALKTGATRLIAVTAFVAIFLFAVPFPLIILAAAFAGFWMSRGATSTAGAKSNHGLPIATTDGDPPATRLGDLVPLHAQLNLRWSLGISALLLLLWLGPVVALLAILGRGDIFTEIALFFSQMAVVTFGGAYAVLAYVAQRAVESYGWLAPGEMLDGLGMAETTPGPLIMVTQFVGFMGAFRQATGLPPLLAGTLGGLLTTWVTFVPCFLWIFLGAPFIERLRGNRVIAGALSGITAAVVGVILNLAIWFAIHTLFAHVREVRTGPFDFDWPELASLNLPALVLAAAALVAVFRFRLSPILVLAGCAVAGLAYGTLSTG